MSDKRYDYNSPAHFLGLIAVVLLLTAPVLVMELDYQFFHTTIKPRKPMPMSGVVISIRYSVFGDSTFLRLPDGRVVEAGGVLGAPGDTVRWMTGE